MKFFKEPFLHFLLLGAALFLLFHLVGPSGEKASGRILISASRIDGLAEIFQRTWQRPPTREEREGLIQDEIRQEVFYREALKLKLDDDDTVVKRRLRQKMEFLTEDSTPLPDPSDAELKQYLKEHPENFRSEARYSFQQVYLNPERHGRGLAKDLDTLLAKLKAGGEKALAQGDPLLLQSKYTDAEESQVSGDFGKEFAKSLGTLPRGEWVGPVKSAYGIHGVRLKEKSEGTTTPFAEIRPKLLEEWRLSLRDEALEKAFQTFKQRYEIVVEPSDPVKDGSALASEKTR